MTKDDLIERYGEYEIERLEKNINDPQAVQKAIDDATQFVNGYVGARYRLSAIPSSISRAIAVVARYYLYKDKATDTVRQDYEDVLAWLKDVANGKVSFDGSTDTPSAHFQTGAFVV